MSGGVGSVIVNPADPLASSELRLVEFKSSLDYSRSLVELGRSDGLAGVPRANGVSEWDHARERLNERSE